MTTIYYAIRYRDPFEILDVKLNMELENTEGARRMTKYAENVEYTSFDKNPAIMESVIQEIDDDKFIGIPKLYLKSQAMNPNNNVLILFSVNTKREVQIECIVMYHQIQIRRETSIAIHAIAIINLPKKDLHLSGSDVMRWFYRCMKTAGGYSIEIDALGSAMKFWNEKMNFSWKKLNPDGKRATIIREIKRKRETQKAHRSKVIQDRIQDEIDNLYYHIPSALMSRTRTDRSSQSNHTSPHDPSPNMLSLQDLEEFKRDILIDNVSKTPKTPKIILRSNSTGEIRKTRKTRKIKPHSA